MEEIFIDKNCDVAVFFKAATILENKLSISFDEKANDLDSYYWDFIFKNIKFVLHYNIYTGVSISLRHSAEATKSEYQELIQISNLIKWEI